MLSVSKVTRMQISHFWIIAPLEVNLHKTFYASFRMWSFTRVEDLVWICHVVAEICPLVLFRGFTVKFVCVLWTKGLHMRSAWNIFLLIGLVMLWRKICDDWTKFVERKTNKKQFRKHFQYSEMNIMLSTEHGMTQRIRLAFLQQLLSQTYVQHCPVVGARVLEWRTPIFDLKAL